MAHHEEAVRIAAQFGGVGAGPGHCPGTVLHEAVHGHMRVFAVVGYHHQDAFRRQRRADKAVPLAFAVGPVATVEEHHHRRAGAGRLPGVCRQINVERQFVCGIEHDIALLLDAAMLVRAVEPGEQRGPATAEQQQADQQRAAGQAL